MQTRLYTLYFVHQNYKLNQQLSPLQLACKHGHISIVNCLLEMGADVTSTDVFNRNALDIAIDSNNRLHL